MATTYCCPFMRGNGPRIYLSAAFGKTFELACECGKLKLPAEVWEKRKKQYCANNPGWKRCQLAADLLEWYEKGEA